MVADEESYAVEEFATPFTYLRADKGVVTYRDPFSLFLASTPRQFNHRNKEKCVTLEKTDSRSLYEFTARVIERHVDA